MKETEWVQSMSMRGRLVYMVEEESSWGERTMGKRCVCRGRYKEESRR